MNDAAHKRAFPALESEGFQQTSPCSPKYNCIAWAAGQHTQWWWPYSDPRYYWPEGVPREVTLTAFLQAFASLGFVPCSDGQLESAVEKVALYAIDGRPTHAARIDITHTVAGLEGPLYGKVIAFLMRQRGEG